MKTKLKLGLTLLLVAGGAWTARAHAFLDHAIPAVGSQVHSALSEVELWFTEKVEPALSRIQVFDADGHEVDRRDVRPDASNAAILVVSLRPLNAGKYKVVWRVVSVDTHVTSGTFGFEIVP
jgi:methionine-rich copper-binding protein CopC